MTVCEKTITKLKNTNASKVKIINLYRFLQENARNHKNKDKLAFRLQI